MQDTRPMWRPRRPSGMAATQPLRGLRDELEELERGLELPPPTCVGYDLPDPAPEPLPRSR